MAFCFCVRRAVHGAKVVYEARSSLPLPCAAAAAVVLALLPHLASAQQALTWDQVKAKFEAANPALKADADNVDEMKARRDHCLSAAQSAVHRLRPTARRSRPMTALGSRLPGHRCQPNFSYLHERDHKRELRLEERAGRHADRRNRSTRIWSAT